MRLIGIDGGGTKTAAILFDEKGRVLAQCAVGPCNPNVLGFDESTARVKEIVKTLSGVGPKMGLGILSAMDSMSIRSAIITQDSKLLSSAPGVGAKTANRIILELKDKIDPSELLSYSDDETVNDAVMSLRQEAYEALVGLGVSNIKATSALNEIEITEDSKIENIIKLLLTKI